MVCRVAEKPQHAQVDQVNYESGQAGKGGKTGVTRNYSKIRLQVEGINVQEQQDEHHHVEACLHAVVAEAERGQEYAAGGLCFKLLAGYPAVGDEQEEGYDYVRDTRIVRMRACRGLKTEQEQDNYIIDQLAVHDRILRPPSTRGNPNRED